MNTSADHTHDDGDSAASPGCPAVYVCVRRTIDWHAPAAVRLHLDASFLPKLSVWDATFNMPYCCFRQQVKHIAQLNLSRIKHVTITTLDEVPQGSLVVPVDDDDWFAPDLAAHLQRAYEPAKRGYYWSHYVLEARPADNPWRWLLRRRFRGTRQKDHIRYTCGSNSYAVVNHGQWGELGRGHARASRHFDQCPDDVKRLALTFSVQNRNLSSQTVLAHRKPTIGAAKLRRRFRRYRTLYARVTLTPTLAWAKPYVDLMAELMDQLRLV